MRHKARHWAIIPGIVVASLAALGALGTAIVKSATYIALPDRVDASEKKLEVHDRVLDKLSVIADQNQQMLQAIQHPGAIAGPSSHASPPTEELSDDGEVKLMRWTDEEGVVRTMCCNGHECWSFSKKDKCER